MESILCNKLIFYDPYILLFATQFRRPYIFQNMDSEKISVCGKDSISLADANCLNDFKLN